MEEWVYKWREDVLEIGEIICLLVEEIKKLFLVLLDEYSFVYISGVVWVNGRLLCNVLISVVKKYGVIFIKGDVILVCEGNYIMGVIVNDEIILVEKVIVIVGVWVNEILKLLGINFLVIF